MERDISFIGLGQMGFGMATNIRKKISKNATMFINDVNGAACERFVKENSQYGSIEVVSSAKEAASKSKVLISIVPASEHVRQVYLDETNGVIAAPKDDDRLILESSTIDADTTRDVGEKIVAAGLGTYADAPVSGGERGAAAGILSFMIGSPDDSPKAGLIKEIVALMAAPNKIFLCGQIGNGVAAKIANNYLNSIFMLAISETMATGIRSGLDPHVLHSVIKNSSGQSWLAENMPPVPGLDPSAPSSNDYIARFPFQLLLKDNGLGIAAAKKVGIRPLMAETAREVFKEASEDPRCKGKDWSSVYLHITDGGA